MSISRIKNDEIKKVLYEAEIWDINRIDSLTFAKCEHSDKYKKRLEEIFNSFDDIEEKNKRRSKRKTFLIAAIIALLALSFSACAVIEPVREYIVEIFDRFTLFTSNSNESEFIEERYKLSYVPAGYVEKEIFDEDVIYKVLFEKGESFISFTQVVPSGRSTYDSEGSLPQEMEIGGNTVYLFTKQKNDYVVWTQWDYRFSISYPEDLDFSEVEKMILSVAPADDEQ